MKLLVIFTLLATAVAVQAIIKYIAAAVASIYLTDCVGDFCHDIVGYAGGNQAISDTVFKGIKALLVGAITFGLYRHPYEDPVPLGRRQLTPLLIEKLGKLDALGQTMGISNITADMIDLMEGRRADIMYSHEHADMVLSVRGNTIGVMSYPLVNGKRDGLRVEQYGMETGDDNWEVPDLGWVDAISQDVANAIVYDIAQGSAWCAKISETNEITDPSSLYTYTALVDGSQNPEFTGAAQCESDQGYTDNA